MTLPTAQATTGDVLQNIGPGTLVWTSVSGITNVYEASLTLTSGQILALNSSPQTIVAAPGAGKYIEVISASVAFTYVAPVYNTNTTLTLINDGAVQYQISNGAALISTANSITNFMHGGVYTGTGSQIIENTALKVSVLNGNPLSGNGTAIVKVIYRIVTI